MSQLKSKNWDATSDALNTSGALVQYSKVAPWSGGDAKRIPAAGFTLFHWSTTAGANAAINVAMLKFKEKEEEECQHCRAQTNKKNGFANAFLGRTALSTRIHTRHTTTYTYHFWK